MRSRVRRVSLIGWVRVSPDEQLDGSKMPAALSKTRKGQQTNKGKEPRTEARGLPVYPSLERPGGRI